MSDHVLPQHTALLAQLERHLVESRYSASAIGRQCAVATNFLRYLERCNLAAAGAQPRHVEMYLRRERRRFQLRHRRAPRSVGHWRASHTAGIHQLLRIAIGQWPPAPEADSAVEAFGHNLCIEFARWLGDERGLAAQSIRDLVAEARRFLSWYCARTANAEDLRALTGADIDAYLQARAPLLRRVSLKSMAKRMRCFMRFAYATGRTTRDLTGSVLSPTLYALESIPSGLSPEQIDAVIRTCRADRSPTGLRDHAIVLLLANYGLRAGEITRLQLKDIDWRGDRLHVRHAKTGAQSVLPLLPAVGTALLAYLRRGRPTTSAREVFIRAHAPYQGFANGSSLYTPIRRRLDTAGPIASVGKRGPHAFRHARAISLLRGGIEPKVIGDVLGHRSAGSVTPYLKLAVEELREVALEIDELLAEGAP